MNKFLKILIGVLFISTITLGAVNASNVTETAEQVSNNNILGHIEDSNHLVSENRSLSARDTLNVKTVRSYANNTISTVELGQWRNRTETENGSYEYTWKQTYLNDNDNYSSNYIKPLEYYVYNETENGDIGHLCTISNGTLWFEHGNTGLQTIVFESQYLNYVNQNENEVTITSSSNRIIPVTIVLDYRTQYTLNIDNGALTTLNLNFEKLGGAKEMFIKYCTEINTGFNYNIKYY